MNLLSKTEKLRELTKVYIVIRDHKVIRVYTDAFEAFKDASEFNPAFPEMKSVIEMPVLSRFTKD